MLDRNGYRLNVGIIITNSEGKVFLGKRYRASGWQFPQGGIQAYETLREALFRELEEEVGLKAEDVQVVACGRQWLKYRLPVHLRRMKQLPLCVGQKQRWFLLRLNKTDKAINLKNHCKQEFEDWRWVDYWQPIQEVVYFKKKVYSLALKDLEASWVRLLRHKR